MLKTAIFDYLFL